MSTSKVIEKDTPLSYVRRVGDWVQEGGNNTILIMGTDRAKKGGPALPNDGLGHINAPGGGKKTGTIHMIAGRADRNGHPDFDKDKSFLYLTMRSNADENLGLPLEGASNDVAAGILKSDVIRLVFRKDVKISIEDGKNYVFMNDSKVVIKTGQTTVTVDGSSVSVKASDVKVECTNAVVNATKTDITSTVNIKGQTTVTGEMKITGALTAGSVTAPTVAAQTGLTIAGKNYAQHTHPITISGVKAGPDTVPAKTLAPL